MRHVCSFFVLAAAVSITGCGQFSGGFSTSTRGGTAVVDLEKVAAETGRDRQLLQSLEMAKNSLVQSLSKNVESAKSQLSAKKKEYGETITENEKKEYSELERNANNQLTQLQNKARVEFEAYKQKQVVQFRAELKPITQEIAAKRGLSIVIPKNDGLLLSVDPGVDITDEVIKVLRERHPVSTTPPTPEPATTPGTQKSATSRRSPNPAKPAPASRTASQADDDEPFR